MPIYTLSSLKSDATSYSFLCPLYKALVDITNSVSNLTYRATEEMLESCVHMKSMLPGKIYPEGCCMSAKYLTSEKPLYT